MCAGSKCAAVLSSRLHGHIIHVRVHPFHLNVRFYTASCPSKSSACAHLVRTNEPSDVPLRVVPCVVCHMSLVVCFVSVSCVCPCRVPCGACPAYARLPTNHLAIASGAVHVSLAICLMCRPVASCIVCCVVYCACARVPRVPVSRVPCGVLSPGAQPRVLSEQEGVGRCAAESPHAESVRVGTGRSGRVPSGGLGNIL